MRYGTRTMPCTASTCGMTGAEDEAGEGGGCSLDKVAGGQTRSSERGPTAPRSRLPVTEASPSTHRDMQQRLGLRLLHGAALQGDALYLPGLGEQ